MTATALPASMPPAVHAYERALPPGRLVTFPIGPLDRLGIGVWAALLFSDAFPTFAPNGQGYGIGDGEALTGALGELSEFVHTSARLATLEPVRASYRELVRRGGDRSAVHPFRLNVPAGSPVDDTSELLWVPLVRWSTGERVYVPLEFVAISGANLPAGYTPLTQPITNGLGAGPTRAFALAHGISELLQRDGNGLRFRALDRGIVLDLDDVRDAGARDLLARYDAAGIEVWPKFASDEFGAVNLYVVGHERSGVSAGAPIMVTACGEAADLDRDQALRKALLEFGAARARKTFAHGPLEHVAGVAPPGYVDAVRARFSLESAEPRALAAMLDWLHRSQDELVALLAPSVFSERTRIRFSALPSWSAPAGSGAAPGVAALADLEQRLAAEDLELLALDASPGGFPDVCVTKAVVPGLEVETLSYHRIGERNARRLLAEDSPLVRQGGEPAGGLRVRLLPDAEERLGGPVWLDPAAVERTVGALYPLYREPEVHTSRLAFERERA